MIGSQIPRIRIEPPRVDTDGPGAAMLMSSYALPLDEWQQLVLDCWLSKRTDGQYAVTSASISAPRQNGKNLIIEARELYGLVINGERILHTAHQGRTSRKAFTRLKNVFCDKRHPEILKLVKSIRQGIGEESIELENGGMIEFTSRSRQAARGYDGISLVIYDEAQELTDEQAEAIMATLAASTTGTRQIIYAGTPPYIGCAGEVFARLRQACIMGAARGEEMRSSWHEWSLEAEDLNGVDLSDRRLWAACNPAYGIRIPEEFIEEEFKTLDDAGFARERLCWWSKPAEAKGADLAIDPELWDGCRSDEPKPDGKTAFGVKFTADGSEVVLAGAVIPSSGPARISLIAREPTGRGLSWLAEWLNERYSQTACVVIDGRNGADVLIDKIQATWKWKGSVIKPTAANVITAASLLLNELQEQTVTWYSAQEDLRESAITATRRAISGGWGFGGSTSAPIEACSLALWGCRTSKRDPSRHMRIG